MTYEYGSEVGAADHIRVVVIVGFRRAGLRVVRCDFHGGVVVLRSEGVGAVVVDGWGVVHRRERTRDEGDGLNGWLMVQV